MASKYILLVLCFFIFFNDVTEAVGLQCTAPELSKENIIEIIQRERATRKDLPTEIPNAIKEVRHQRCHYIYNESSPTELKSHAFTINQYGVIVDASIPHTTYSMNCPPIDLSKEFLAERLSKIRLQESDIPHEPQSYTSDLEKIGCYFMYSEDYESPGKFQLFMFDFNGELIDFFISD
jgi:hypothetical protein